MMNEHVYTIPGWMGESELEYLHAMVRNAPPDAIIVELGAWKGRSTGALYEGIHHNQTVCTVDSWLGQEDLRFKEHSEVITSDVFLQFMSHMHELEIIPRWYTPFMKGPTYLRMLSDDAASLFVDGSLFRVIVDSDHRAVGHDIDKWSPKLRSGGRMCGHDWNWTGVKEQIEQRLVIAEVIGDFWVCDPNLESRE